MKQKLTLTVEETMITRAKIYAKLYHKSVSEIVEELFANFSLPTSTSENTAGNSPIVQKLHGCLEDLQNEELDKVKEDYLTEKYLHD